MLKEIIDQNLQMINSENIQNLENSRNNKIYEVSIFDLDSNSKLLKNMNEIEIDKMAVIIDERLSWAFGKQDFKKISYLIDLAKEENYTDEHLFNAIKNLIIKYPYPEWKIANILSYDKKVYTYSGMKRFIEKEKREEKDFIRCEHQTTKEIHYWDIQNGELPEILKFKSIEKENFIIIQKDKFRTAIPEDKFTSEMQEKGYEKII